VEGRINDHRTCAAVPPYPRLKWELHVWRGRTLSLEHPYAVMAGVISVEVFSAEQPRALPSPLLAF
jgi:hypothetical protein